MQTAVNSAHTGVCTNVENERLKAWGYFSYFELYENNITIIKKFVINNLTSYLMLSTK